MSNKKNTHLKNFFHDSLKEDYKTTDEAASEYMANLIAGELDPDILAYKNEMKPSYDAFELLRTTKDVGHGSRHSLVTDFTQRIVALRETELDKWMDSIALVKGRTSADFIRLFPKKKTPFNTGIYSHRLDAVNTLLTAIGTDAALATIKAQIQTYYTDTDAVELSKSTEKATVNSVTLQERNAIDLLCKVMFRIYHRLMIKFEDNTDTVGTFVPFKYFHKEATATQTSGIAGIGNVVTIWVRHWKAGEMIKLENTGTEPIRYFLAAVRGKDVPGAGQIIAPGATVTVDVTTLGAAGLKHLSVIDESNNLPGHYQVELV